IFKFNLKSGLRQIADHISLVKRPLERLRVAKALEEKLRQFGIVRTEIKIVGEPEIGPYGPRHSGLIDSVLRGLQTRPLKFANLAIPRQERVALSFRLLEFGVAPFRCKD